LKATLRRVGGYDPKLGPKHPENRDPTLEPSDDVEAGEPEATIAAAAQASPGHRMRRPVKTRAERLASHAPNLFVTVRDRLSIELALIVRRNELEAVSRRSPGQSSELQRLKELLGRLADVRWP
jgi:hypothetical protein